MAKRNGNVAQVSSRIAKALPVSYPPMTTSVPAPKKRSTAVEFRFTRVEEKKTCWSYIRQSDSDPAVFVGDYIYVRKAVFAPSEPPPTLIITIARED